MRAPLGLARAQRQQRRGAIERLNLALFIDRQEQRAVGRVRYSPTMSRTLSMNSGSFDSLKVSTRCGCSANAFQMRAMAVWLMSHCLARLRVDQCVASRGVDSSVVVKTRSTSASVILRGTPGRGSSSKPSRRRARNRPRHLPTVCFVTCTSRAIAVAVSPAAHRSTSRARKASACAVVGRRAQRSSVSRSSVVSTIGCNGSAQSHRRVLLVAEYDGRPKFVSRISDSRH